MQHHDYKESTCGYQLEIYSLTHQQNEGRSELSCSFSHQLPRQTETNSHRDNSEITLQATKIKLNMHLNSSGRFGRTALPSQVNSCAIMKGETFKPQKSEKKVSNTYLFTSVCFPKSGKPLTSCNDKHQRTNK